MIPGQEIRFTKWEHVLKNPFWQITGLFIVLKLCLHLFTNTNYELHRDEMLYFNQGAHLAWGNATVPPFIGWVAYLVETIFGYSVFGIRLLPALLGGASILLIAKMINDLGGKILALSLACFAYVLSPGFLIFDTLFTVNVFDQFFWLLLTFLFFKLIRTNNPRYWIWIGIFSGLAFLNKYLIIYLLAGLFVGILSTPKRILLINRYFVFAVIAGIVIISPNLFWQFSHGWPILIHISELEKTQMAYMTYDHFLIDLFGLNYLSTLFWLTGFFAILFLKSENQHRYLGIVALTVFVLFIMSRGKAYYTMGIIPVLFALSGYVFEKYFTEKLVFVNYFILVVIIASSCLALPFSLPLLSFEQLSRYAKKTNSFVSYPFSRWEDGKIHPVSQVFSDMTGWKQLVSMVNAAYQRIPVKERTVCTIYAERNYGYAGAVHFYGNQYNLPDAITFLDSYVLWAPDTIAKGPVIYINYDIAGLGKLFKECIKVGTIDNKFFRENGLKVFLCTNPTDDLQDVYAQKANAEKMKYRSPKNYIIK